MLGFLKYVGAVIVFFLIYIICSALAYWGIWFANRDMNSWILPYFVGPVAGVLGVMAALHAVECLFSDIRLRVVAWVFVGVIGTIYIPLFLGLILGVVGVMGLDHTSHFLWTSGKWPETLQLLTAASAAWYLTRRDRTEFESG